ncbi:4-(cytidine 5'-diphospho)-2-C-methyl-D-erythritol kinase [Clostridium tertium]|jgi:4-diphosphocytidyl-2-C-methyl-D-erythritol kinase|uniref:4-diphosphocytidyl-2-C-methyl-D-erythritol kinase n=1 Tax=Clostridium tertium TaxID=1559 RepID=A0A9X3XMR2_9CLOT|nr:MULTISPECIES: 4-(cytidine 5'-diphospho)-2-C-methyl-D-erythritol kinase [Clostridium]EEH99267.1 4-diphosphocytidyl-2-C-methyl-D-erythritol kinase [Clostridium sp. 7_2_43FAA]MDB1940384.1 4-(cytidine 5'-diphospho)-2-C-methyl-D-erythritol kinase [Clostridium tertium]MDB1949528.1 4-(cytidine 5'-diphospho)-2-C-methyl-D-erythritol kinase [Clostridium tertium]MDB1956703.1 4-(cytidine 5'-diphospho)-2-C-methyl-D-erythritol kinase [Clostridium tertium]MDB1957955.1 4-(cytidine 5'-diphospho)-2-C-methyl-
MRMKAYAKVNISLDIVGKREDGYHLLEMIMQSIDLYDEIVIEKQKKEITIKCNKPYVPTDERNLAYKAAQLFIEKYNIDSGVNINIKKNIPVCAGLAGGSTDAATVLKIMNSLFNINASDEELMILGLKLGADVPYCIKGGTALCKGIGEEVTALKGFKDKVIVLVKPPFGVSTNSVYQEFNIEKARNHPNTNLIIDAINNDNLKMVCDNMKNLLENVTLRKHKILINIKEDMRHNGAMGTMMSGSGPTVFAFFDDMLKAQRCFEKMKEKYSDVFITRTI